MVTYSFMNLLSIYLSMSSTQSFAYPLVLPGVSPEDLEHGKYIERLQGGLGEFL